MDVGTLVKIKKISSISDDLKGELAIIIANNPIQVKLFREKESIVKINKDYLKKMGNIKC